jgi:tetratricopeptide (TPR) repeat protein
MAALSSKGMAAFDVFLSHRGPDTKRSFAIWLKKELEEQRITTFLDDRSMQAGDDAPGSVEQAMQTAEWGVVTLSPGFFASGYCMKELKVFLDRGRAILIGFGLTANECNADLIVGRAKGTVWEQHGGRLWESCSTGGQVWSEVEWREVVGRAKRITILELQKVDGYWDKCITEAVRITGERLGRPVFSGERRVDLTPFHRNKDFLGREKELEGVAKGLAESYGRVCITGMAGIGKTQLALEYNYRHQREYGQILWVDAEGGNLESNYIGLASHLGVQLDAPQGEPGVSMKGEVDSLSKVREALETTTVPCLLVLDNVDNQSGLAEVVPRSGPCHVIATSRLRALENFAKVEMGVLEKADGLRLLRGQEAFSEEAEQHVQTLAARLGYLTLALAVSSRILAEGRLSPLSLLKRLEQRGPCVFENTRADAFSKKHPDLVTLFQTSLDMLATDAESNRVAKELALHLIWAGGWFASAPVRVELLAASALRSLKASRNLEGSEVQWRHVDEAVGLLNLYALASSTNNGRVAFHPLVQSFGKFKGGEGAGAAMIQGLVEVGEVKQDLDHYENAIEHAISVEEPSRATIPLGLQYGEEILTKIATNLCKYYTVLFRPLAVDRVNEKCALLLRTLHVPEGGLWWAYFFYARASILHAKERYRDAEPLFRRALEIFEAKLGPGHPDTVQSLNDLACILKDQGKYGEAEPFFRRALEIREVELGPCHPDTAASLHNLACLLAAQGRCDDAEPLCKRALKVREAELGPCHPETAWSLNDMASLLKTQGRYGEAEPLFRRALAIREAELGPCHPLTARSCNKLASLFEAQGKYSDAEPLYRHAVKVLEDELGADHPRTSGFRSSLVRLLDIQARGKKTGLAGHASKKSWVAHMFAFCGAGGVKNMELL